MLERHGSNADETDSAASSTNTHKRLDLPGWNYRQAHCSRRIIGWSIDSRQDADLVVGALAMAVARRNPSRESTILHSDHGTQYTSWAFGKRLRDAGLLGSMGTVGDCYDNAMMESFWGTMQLELLDTRTWETREELANAIFEWIECWYNPYRRHSSIGMHSPAMFESLYLPSDTTE
jgi:putative transposase